MCTTLSSEPYNLPTVVLSIDDLYLPHDEQQALARSHPDNPLVQHRGQPSTHDVELGTALFSTLHNRDPNIRIPSYDKSAFGGQGDRRHQSEWQVINKDAQDKRVEVVIFEGWCVGFRALTDEDLEIKWQEAKRQAQSEDYDGQLGRLSFENVRFVNDALRQYDALTE